VLDNNEIFDGERHTQTSRDPIWAAPIRPEFELGIYEFT